MKQHQVYILDDDLWYGELIKFNIELNPDCIATCFNNIGDFLNEIKKTPPAIVTIDLGLPEGNGSEVLNKVKKTSANIDCIIISGNNEIETALNLLKTGASDYIVKNDSLKERIWVSIQNSLEKIHLRTQVKKLEEKVNDSTELIGSKINNLVLPIITKAAKTNINISITGETGTGKEVVAKLIHNKSERRNQNFVALNLSSIPDSLFESELFGHEKGAFTGADKKRIGAIENADKGVLFLDEIAELSLTNQTKLLRVIQEQTITPLGSNQPIKVDIKIITATHKNLNALVQNGDFREDLFYRIVGLNIHLPPLRERKTDILDLASSFLNDFNNKNSQQKTLNKATIKKLESHSFPGNIRELKATIELAATMADSNEIDSHDFHFHSLPTNNSSNLDLPLKIQTRKIVEQLLEREDQNISQVARILEVTRSTIYNILNNHSYARNSKQSH